MSGALIVLYCRPFTCAIVALDIAPEHRETYEDRRSRGAFCPRTLWNARPEVFRTSTEAERVAGGDLQVHEWIAIEASEVRA